jgi:putative ABC transport system ATP-binding protein
VAVIEIKQLHKVYKIGEERVHALRGVDLSIEANEFVAIMGASGSGKSTLMNILGCLDKPTKGVYLLNGNPTHKMGMSALAQVRNEDIGFIFQSFELLGRASALKNVILPMLYSAGRLFTAKKRAKAALQKVGLADRMHHRPNQLSGGQRQRVAIARALVNDPAILLADEPTGNLDSTTSNEIIELFKGLHDDGQTILVVTHEEEVAGHAQRIVRLMDGEIVSDHPTQEDPIHQDWLRSMAEGFGSTSGEQFGGPTPSASVVLETPEPKPEPKPTPSNGTPNGASSGASGGAPNGAPAHQNGITKNGTHSSGDRSKDNASATPDPAEASS